MTELTDKVLAGDRLALSRLLTRLESNSAEGEAALNEIFPHTGKAHLVGVTGSPGAGKSSLVNKLALAFRKGVGGAKPVRVGIIAVDPSSPFSGGALLGDRVRMRELSGDSGVFIRSMASRGAIGGLSAATSRFVHAFDAAGYELILIETIGAGQAEVEIARLAHTTIVVEAPGMGDDIQANKAGILEIADILVLNKADLPDANQTYRVLKAGLDLDTNPRGGWQVPLLKAVSTQGQGIEEIAAKVTAHRKFLMDKGLWDKAIQARLKTEVDSMLREQLLKKWMEGESGTDYESMLKRVFAREVTPSLAAADLVNKRS
ncbi:MAG TPA: methylmalonyl Co-A mutase-associated GTPase MeaB [Bellilinea sp.]|nr:methylmalonyl Co-A mutase-associated GTPase MeaB [Bellilinea sp.]